MATLATTVVGHAGAALSLASAGGGGDKAQTGAGVFLVVKNADSGSHTVTLAVPETVDSLTVASRVVTVANGATEFIPLPDLYKQPSDGLAHITYDGVTSVTVAVYRIS